MSFITKFSEIKKEVFNNLENNLLNSKGRFFILTIAIDNYLNEEVYYTCKQNSKALLQIFVDYHNIDSNNIYKIYDESATKENIILHLEYLSNKLREDDKLVIHFSGHGMFKENLAFFIPYEGKKQHFASCISNHYFFSHINQIKSNQILCVLDSDNSYSQDEEELKSPEEENRNVELSKLNQFYKKFIKFLLTKDENRQKESFLFLKGKNKIQKVKNKSNESVFIDSFEVNNLVRNKTRSLISEVKINTHEVLNELEEILKNNDSDYLSRAKTLNFQLRKNEVLLSKNEINSQDYNSNVDEIKNFTIELIQKINDKGFYVIRMPEPNLRKEIDESKKTKILFLSANPIDSDPLRLDKELREIEYELLKSRFRDKFELIKLGATRINDFQQALLDNNPHFIHFSGHGNCEGIALLDNDDKTKLVRSEPLAILFKLFSKDIQCVFLNSCHSIAQSKEISKFISKVVCMSQAVPDNVAIQFAASFYKSIGAGRDINFSFEFAKNSIDLYDFRGKDIPVLLP